MVFITSSCCGEIYQVGLWQEEGEFKAPRQFFWCRKFLLKLKVASHITVRGVSLFSCLNFEVDKAKLWFNSWASCVVCIDFTRCLLFLGFNLWLYRYKITFIPVLQNVGQTVTMLVVVEVCICDPFRSGNQLIFSNLVIGVWSCWGTKLSMIKSNLLFSGSFPLTTNLFKVPVLINLPLHDQTVWIFCISRMRDWCKNRSLGRWWLCELERMREASPEGGIISFLRRM